MEEKIADQKYETIVCKRCHRRLKDDESKKLGYGKVCYKKICNKHHDYLFELEVADEK